MKNKKFFESMLPTLNQEYFGINKLLRLFKVHQEDLNILLDGFPLPKHNEFILHFCNHDEKKFTIEEGILVLISYSKNEVIDFSKNNDYKNNYPIQEIVQLILNYPEDTYNLNKLLRKLKILKRQNPNKFEQILNSKPFPSFFQFKSYFCNHNETNFTLHQGLNILYGYGRNEICDFDKLPLNDLLKQRAEKQNKKLKKMDEKGLLGLNRSSNPAISKAKKNSRNRKSNSVWTVKKK